MSARHYPTSNVINLTGRRDGNLSASINAEHGFKFIIGEWIEIFGDRRMQIEKRLIGITMRSV